MATGFEFWIWFACGALVYGALVTLVIAGAMRVLRGMVPLSILPLILLTSTFAFLTQHPFPSPSALQCPVQSAAAQWQLFQFVTPFRALAEAGTPLLGWLTNRWAAAATMNFTFCWVIGLCWRRSGHAVWSAPFFGFGLSLSCEFMQLTGVLGLYPCAYRSFNVDDLLLNTLGVTFGAAFHWLIVSLGELPQSD